MVFALNTLWHRVTLISVIKTFIHVLLEHLMIEIDKEIFIYLPFFLSDIEDETLDIRSSKFSEIC